ncbi:hypothetical protein C8R47DRAFT_1149738 [Mycena vitilis]|nr:hypothetical protein C8R47DRAFT_1149738 [Mycena vitilis]
MNISQLLCSPPPSQASSSRPFSNGAPPVAHHDDSRSSQGSPSPSSSTDPSYKVINRCGNCRQRGHNRKTCPQPEIPKPPPQPTRPRAQGCCGYCGATGHNRTSCRLGPPK